MEQYREKLKVQNITLSICIVILALFSILGFAAEAELIPLTPSAGDSHWQSMWRGFMSGAAMGVLALMLFGLIRNLRAMKDEKTLKKLYIKEHDERAIQVWTYARSAALQTFLLLGLVAVVVTGYFSIAVSITIMACIFCSSIIALFFKFYYNKKF